MSESTDQTDGGVLLRVVESGFDSIDGSERERRQNFEDSSQARLGHRARGRTQVPGRQWQRKHLQVLSHAGLVDNHHHGREARYAVRPQELTRCADWLQALGDQWERRLQDIKTLAEMAPSDTGNDDAALPQGR